MPTHAQFVLLFIPGENAIQTTRNAFRSFALINDEMFWH